MKKVLFFCLPSVSVINTLTKVMEELSSSGYDLVYYNSETSRPQGSYSFSFKAYPEEFDCSFSNHVSNDTSYFDFANILINASEGIIQFLKDEVKTEKPDLIIHSHLAAWGKLVALHFRVPSVTLFTTFILDRKIMLPYIRGLNVTKESDFGHISEAMLFHKRIRSLYSKMGLKHTPDLWDFYINKGDLNILFILKNFQPNVEWFGDAHYLGYPTPVENVDTDRKAYTVYVSMGTVVKTNTSFYQLCIEVLGEMDCKAIISVGNIELIKKLKNPYPNIEVVSYTDQKNVLKNSAIFITHGGMASIHEAIYSHTPMIVVPTIPEQKFNADNVEKAGVGIQIKDEQVSHKALKEAVNKVKESFSQYRDNILALLDQVGDTSAEKRASLIISEFIENKGELNENRDRIQLGHVE